MLPLLAWLRKVSPSKNSAIFLLVTVNVVTVAYILVSRDSVKKALAMYEHPAVIRQVQFKEVRGPVRIIERIIERPGGEKVTERTIVQAPVVKTSSEAASSMPMIPAAPTSRYLLGASWQTSLSQPRNLTAWAGYSFGRLDLLGGVGWKEGDQFAGHLMLVSRWGN